VLLKKVALAPVIALAAVVSADTVDAHIERSLTGNYH
jgi:hypothetical protein